VGVDIAAQTAAVAYRVGSSSATPSFSIAQTPEGHAGLAQRLQATGVSPQETLVVLEATGSYWIRLATLLVEAGFVVSVINPAQAHHFAKALLKQAKTDAVDAQTLLELAARLQPSPWTPPPAIYAELQQRLAQRETLLDLRQQVRNQLHALRQNETVVASVRLRMETLIETLTAQIEAVEAEVVEVLRQEHAWCDTIERLQTIPGIGMLTATWLVVTTLNFSLCPTPEAATAYAGLAPHVHRSGTSVKRRASIGHTGNGRLRTALYLATLSAARYNPAIQPFYARLRAAGKPAKVARCAAARKLLHIAWAIATKGEVFDPEYALRAAA
jgi:transposase